MSADLPAKEPDLSIHGLREESMKRYPLRMVEKGTNTVFMCLEQGQAHFFFSWKNRLHWLATDIDVAKRAIIALRKEVRVQ